MGRETRQARRSRERKAAAQRRKGTNSRRSSMTWGIIAGAAVVLAALVFFGTQALANKSSASNGVPTLPPETPGKTIDHLVQCDDGMSVGYHVHAHLTILDAGKPIVPPATIGHNYAHDCLYWTHTHNTDGIIHIESPKVVSLTLGNFFDVWHQPLNSHQIASGKVKPGQSIKAWVNLKPYTGNIRNIKLGRHTQITLEIGPSFSKPVPYTFAQGL